MTDKKIKKVFVIDDWEEFGKKVNKANSKGPGATIDVLRVIQPYEIDMNDLFFKFCQANKGEVL